MTKRIRILYEDDVTIVFDKPSGLLVIPTFRHEDNTLVNYVNQQYTLKGSWRLWPCHRLDRETSGAIIFAKGKRSQKLMMEAFKQHSVKKQYVAFVHGRLSKKSGVWQKAIQNSDQKKFKKYVPAKSAITHYRVRKEYPLFSLVEVQPVTGRTNQIRIHFSQQGHPLVGDRKYSFQRDYALKFRRTALHASVLEWPHPVTHQKINVQSDLPNDMEVFLGNYRNVRS